MRKLIIVSTISRVDVSEIEREMAAASSKTNAVRINPAVMVAHVVDGVLVVL